MAVVSIESDHVYVFGQGNGYKKRIYLLFDGIHYDIVVRAFAEGLEEAYDTTTFKPDDVYAMAGT